MVTGFVWRLRDLMNIIQDCRRLREAIAEGRDPDAFALDLAPEKSAFAFRHRDHGLALWTAAGTALSLLACCALWIATGWPDGASAAIFSAVLGSLLAGSDDPLPTFRRIYWVLLTVIAVNGIYTFGVLPRIATFELLIFVLMPVFVIFGWLAARPATARVGSFLAVFTSVQLALNSSYLADFASFANSSVALMVGVGLTAVISGVVRLFGAGWIANRLVRGNRETLTAVADGKTPRDRLGVAALMQHRLALLAPRIETVSDEARSNAANLRQLRTALDIIDLRQASLELSHPVAAAIDKLLARLAPVDRTGALLWPLDELLQQLDGAIAFTLRESASEPRDRAVIELAEIRLALSAGFANDEPREVEPRKAAA
jgi:uncharacterized membrane protein YccC